MDDPKSEKVALFRYGLIATLVLEKLSRGELMRRARELARISQRFEKKPVGRSERSQDFFQIVG